MDPEIRDYLGTMEQRIITAVQEGDDALRAAMEVGDRALLEAMEVAHESLRKELVAENRATRVLFEALESNVRTMWTEGEAALIETVDRRFTEQAKVFDQRVGTLSAVVRNLERRSSGFDHE